MTPDWNSEDWICVLKREKTSSVHVDGGLIFLTLGFSEIQGENILKKNRITYNAIHMGTLFLDQQTKLMSF